jgi:hypothetical protein
VPDPFITPQDVVDWIGRGTATDPGLLIATDSACDMCRDIAEQQFNRGTTTYTLDGTGTDALLLPELPVNSAGTVLVNGTAVTDYTLNGNGILFRGTAGEYPRPVWPEGRQNVVVTADHGYADADLPRSVRMVALSAAARIAVQGVAGEESIGAVRIKYATSATEFTPNELRILRKHRPTR